MPAKLIFLENNDGDEIATFCPLVKWGCRECPFGTKHGCDGEYGETTAYRLVRHFEYSAFDYEFRPIG